jgi:hypothetical protein
MVFLAIVLLLAYITLHLADGGYDPYYLRFTTGKQTSLILGSSRAAHGLQPMVLNKVLKRNDVYNYAFSITHSPYGPTYLNSIKNKIKPSSNAIFIVTVDSWSLSTNDAHPNDTAKFGEAALALGKISSTDKVPNYKYLLTTPGNPYLMIFKKSRTMLLHEDGWLEVTIAMDSSAVDKRTREKIAYYRQVYMPVYKFSSLRFSYLEQTIAYLKEKGKVYLVKLPAHPSILEFDRALMPDFNEKMNGLSEKYQVPYLDLSPDALKFEYIDGNHLYKSSGAAVSNIIGEWIKAH